MLLCSLESWRAAGACSLSLPKQLLATRHSTLLGLVATAAAAVLLQNRRCCWKKATTRPGSTSVGGCERAGTATAVSRPAADYGSKCALLLRLLWLWWCCLGGTGCVLRRTLSSKAAPLASGRTARTGL